MTTTKAEERTAALANLGLTPKRAKELALGVRDCDRLLKEVNARGGVAQALEAFRHGAATAGKYGITQEMVPVVRAFGSVRDKVLLICHTSLDGNDTICGTNISKATALAIRNDIQTTATIEEKSLYSHCMAAFLALKDLRFMLYNSAELYKRTMHELARILDHYELALKMDHLKAAVASHPDAAPIVNDFVASVHSSQFYAEGSCSYPREAGYLWEEAGLAAEDAAEALSDIKAFHEAIRQWTAEQGIPDFIPGAYIREFKFAQQPFPERFHIAPKYFKGSGYEKAIVRTFDTVEPNPLAMEIIFQNLNSAPR